MFKWNIVHSFTDNLIIYELEDEESTSFIFDNYNLVYSAYNKTYSLDKLTDCGHFKTLLNSQILEDAQKESIDKMIKIFKNEIKEIDLKINILESLNKEGE